MKRYIKAMAFSRKDAESHIRALSKVIGEHIIKCVVYGDSLNCYSHWVNDELTSWFYDINTTYLKIDRKPPKFRYQDYDEFIFSQFGEDLNDMRISLSAFASLNFEKYGGNYPDIEISKDIVSNMFQAVAELSRKMCRLLSTSSAKDPVSREEIRDLLHEVLDQYK